MYRDIVGTVIQKGSNVDLTVVRSVCGLKVRGFIPSDMVELATGDKVVLEATLYHDVFQKVQNGYILKKGKTNAHPRPQR